YSSVSTTSVSDVCTLSLHDALPILLEDDVFAFPDDVLPGGGVRFCCHGIRRGFICLTTDKNDSYKYTFYKSKVHFIILDFQNLRSEEHTSELQSRENLVCRLLLEKQ